MPGIIDQTLAIGIQIDEEEQFLEYLTELQQHNTELYELRERAIRQVLGLNSLANEFNINTAGGRPGGRASTSSSSGGRGRGLTLGGRIGLPSVPTALQPPPLRRIPLINSEPEPAVLSTGAERPQALVSLSHPGFNFTATSRPTTANTVSPTNITITTSTATVTITEQARAKAAQEEEQEKKKKKEKKKKEEEKLPFMEAISEEFQKLEKKANLGKVVLDVDRCIKLMENARAAIARDPKCEAVELAKLQQAMATALEKVNNDHRDIYGALNRYGKALDKKFKTANAFSTTDYDAITDQTPLINRAIGMHLIREGQFSVAETFMEEAPEPLDIKPDLQQNFAQMYKILEAMQQRRDLAPAIAWARENAAKLEQRGSNLEFELCKLQFVWYFLETPTDGPMKAIQYARSEFRRFDKHLGEIQKLMCSLAYIHTLESSPYAKIYADPEKIWNDVAHAFTKEFCSLQDLSAESPLYIAATAGAIALPTLLKMASIMKEKKTEWSTVNELPVEIPLPPGYQFHSIFVCPVSKDQTTEENPPMMLLCGHVIAQESLQRLAKGGSSGALKCPYCPKESILRQAWRVII
ncbi:hypothetical protein RUND412_007671 [Rhizina undulata]